MAVLDEDFGTDLTLVEGNGGVRSCPMSLPERAPRDLRSLYERERARADAAEARAEELRWAEVASRSDAGSWKSRFKACRRRLSEAVEETKEARRAARDVASLQAEVARLETLLCEAGIGSNESSTTEALRKENARLRKALVAPEYLFGQAVESSDPRMRWSAQPPHLLPLLLFTAVLNSVQHGLSERLRIGVSGVIVRSGRGMGAVKRISHVEAKPTRCCLSAGNGISRALSSSAWRFWTRILAPT